MSCEVEQIDNEVDNEVDNDDVVDEPVEFVELKDNPDYEISTTYPFIIRKKVDGFIPKETIYSNGYVYVKLNNKPHLKHRLIALQFIENPNQLNEVDHISRNKTDYHIENLRWVSHSTNQRNKTSHNGVQVRYVDSIPDDAIVVDYYETRTERHEFQGYYYHNGVFYYDNEMNYRVLNVNTTKSKCKFVAMISKSNKSVSVYINRFLEQHDLI